MDLKQFCVSFTRNDRKSKCRSVVRELASHQCGLGLIPGVDAILGLSLLLVLVFASRVFSGYSGFPSSTKTNISKFQFDLETVDERTTLWKPLKFSFIRLFTNGLQCAIFFLSFLRRTTAKKKKKERKKVVCNEPFCCML